MLQPAKTKWRKQQKGRVRGVAVRGVNLAFGDFGLQGLEHGWITARQIEACRVAITRSLKRGGKMWIRIFPHKPISKKPVEVRMGRGKGAVELWVATVRRGRMLFEIEGLPEAEAKEVLNVAAHKLPIKTKVVAREGTRDARS
ncbi:MAG: 50S ribosomal protein L16 [Deltaproteobacteria bacterium CG11_big_fil_rev_8_21_14_0_20_49_13]|nr:MAG: 50S ribosomal protein L16 [Deltaproteobacteria bacterium CG11_big_fil_rev_8_21_14_0_20_49_13]